MESHRNPLIGAVLSEGRYRIQSRLQSGPLEEAYLADDLNLETQVTIKVPAARLLSLRGFRSSYTHILKEVTKIRHPNLVAVSDSGMATDIPFTVSAWLSGGTIQQRMGFLQDEPVEKAIQEVCTWLKAVAAALDTIHQNNYVHCRVTTSSIKFDGYGSGFLDDFTVPAAVVHLSISSGDSALLTTFLDDVDSAPEIAEGMPQSASDQFFLAKCFLDVVGSSDHIESVEAIAVADAIQQASLFSEFPQDGKRRIQRVVAKGLSTLPADRYPNCSNFIQALQTVTNSRSATDTSKRRAVSSAAAPAPTARKSDAQLARQQQLDDLRREITTQIVGDPNSEFREAALLQKPLVNQGEMVTKATTLRNQLTELEAQLLKVERLEQKLEHHQGLLRGHEKSLKSHRQQLGNTAFESLMAGEISDQPLFAERKTIADRLVALKKDQNATATGTSFLARTRAKAAKAVAWGKVTYEEQKIAGAEKRIGAQLIETMRESDVTSNLTQSVLAQIAACRTQIETEQQTIDDLTAQLQPAIGANADSAGLRKQIQQCRGQLDENASDRLKLEQTLVDSLLGDSAFFVDRSRSEPPSEAFRLLKQLRQAISEHEKEERQAGAA